MRVSSQFSSLGKKEFFIPKLQTAQWHEARGLCEEFDMEFARLELATEADYIMQQATIDKTKTFGIYFDGVTATPGQKTGWFWGKTKDPVGYTIKWFGMNPNNRDGVESCLEIAIEKGVAGFNDVPCSNTDAVGAKLFMCQVDNTVYT